MHEDLSEEIDDRLLLQLARGFTALFWGLGLVVLLLTGALHLPLLDRWPLPRHAPATLVLIAGAILLWRSPVDNPAWRGRARSLLLAVLAQVYLLPFFRWWLEAPQQAYFCANMAAALLATAWMLLAANLLAAELGRSAHNPVLVIESRLCGWSVLVLGGVLLSLSLVAEVREVFLHPLLAGRPLWLHTGSTARSWLILQGLICLPFLLTMASVWEARGAALTCLARQRCRPAAPGV